MKSIETQGKTVDQAIELGLYKLNTTRDQVKITILEEAGLFNKARVRLSLNQTSEEEGKVLAIAEELTKKMGLNVDVFVEETEEGFSCNITGPDAALAIGKHGDCLESIGYLINQIYNKGKAHAEYKRISVDSDNYRARREATLVILAKKMASKAIRENHHVKLEPMTSYERRIIHATLADNSKVETESQGNEPNRFVVIKLKLNNHKKADTKTDAQQAQEDSTSTRADND